MLQIAAGPQRVWVHWVLHDIPAAITSLPSGAGGRDLPSGTLGDLKHPAKAKLEQAMEGHVLAMAELMGTHKKERG